MGQKKKPVSIVSKKLQLELIRDYGMRPTKAMAIVDILKLKKGESYTIQDTRGTNRDENGKQVGQISIGVNSEYINNMSKKPDTRESRNLKVFPGGSPKKLEYYDKGSFIPDRSSEPSTPAVTEWWSNVNKKSETWYQNMRKNRDGAPAEILYNESGEVEKEIYFKGGISQDEINNKRKEGNEFFNKSQEARLDRQDKGDIKRKEMSDREKAKNALRFNKDTVNGLPSGQDSVSLDTEVLPEPEFTSNSENPIDLFIPNNKSGLDGPSSNPETKDWKNASPDQRINYSFDDENPDLNSNSSMARILSRRSNKKTPLESPDLKLDSPSSPVMTSQSKPSKYQNIIDKVSSFLKKKHIKELSPETMKKVSDYYRNKNREDKSSPGVLPKYSKEFSGRRRDKFPISTTESVKYFESIIKEAIELIEKELN